MSTKEADVLAVAAELVRAKWEDDVPEHLADRMASWAFRLRAAHDELLASLAVTDADCKDPLGILTDEQYDELLADLGEMAKLRRKAEQEAAWLPMA